MSRQANIILKYNVDFTDGVMNKKFQLPDNHLNFKFYACTEMFKIAITCFFTKTSLLNSLKNFSCLIHIRQKQNS